MSIVERIYAHNRIPGADKLFVSVQRLEFGLKRANLRHGNRADASWQKLGRKLGPEFFDRVTRIPEVRVLVDAPPATLEVENGELVWVEQPSPRDSTELLDTVRNVRNSLFHGEKDNGIPRDRALVSAALMVIEEAFSEAQALADTDPSLGVFCRVIEGAASPPLRRRPS
jgi:hypothetical protein